MTVGLIDEELKMKCPKCGRFLKNIGAIVNGLDEIKKVVGTCSRDGRVEPTDWEYDDFKIKRGKVREGKIKTIVRSGKVQT
jgi:hypothetical protein